MEVKRKGGEKCVMMRWDRREKEDEEEGIREREGSPTKNETTESRQIAINATALWPAQRHAEGGERRSA